MMEPAFDARLNVLPGLPPGLKLSNGGEEGNNGDGMRRFSGRIFECGESKPSRSMRFLFIDVLVDKRAPLNKGENGR